MPNVAESYLLAIWANRDTGKPFSGKGRIGHVVRVGPNPNMPIVQEFSDGGDFQHEDCAPASMQSRLLEGEKTASIRLIEILAGTSINGTGFPGCLNALNQLGVPSQLSAGSCPPGYVMNPMIDSIVDIAEFPAYLAASQGGCIVMAASVPPKPPEEASDMAKLSLFVAPIKPTGEGVFISDGMHYRHVLNPADMADINGTGPWFNADSQPLRMWANGTPVADLAAFGVPADAATATLVGVTFP